MKEKTEQTQGCYRMVEGRALPCRFAMENGCCNYIGITGQSRIKLKAMGVNITPPNCALYTPPGAQVYDGPPDLVLPGSRPKVKKARPRKLDEDAFLRLWQEGVSASEISVALKVSKAAIYQEINRLGLEKRRVFDENALLELYQKGMTDEEIGQQLGYSRQSVAAHRTKMGLLGLWRGRPAGYSK